MYLYAKSTAAYIWIIWNKLSAPVSVRKNLPKSDPRVNIFLLSICATGPDRVSVDWCHHGAAEEGRLDSPLGPSCSGLFPHAWRPLDLLGGGHEGIVHLLDFFRAEFRMYNSAHLQIHKSWCVAVLNELHVSVVFFLACIPLLYRSVGTQMLGPCNVLFVYLIPIYFLGSLHLLLISK